MQKDIHYYLTAAMLIEHGMDKRSAVIAAAMDQLVDEKMPGSIPGIFHDLRELARFHFAHNEHTIVCHADNCIARQHVYEGFESSLFEFGIHLHTWQDTFSHEGFAGYSWPGNSVHPWYSPYSLAPNIGHAEMGVLPDVVGEIWTDYRTGKRVVNTDRFLNMAYAFDAMLSMHIGLPGDGKHVAQAFFAIQSYAARKQYIVDWYDVPRCKDAIRQVQSTYAGQVHQAMRDCRERVDEIYRHLDTDITDAGAKVRIA